MTIYKPYCDKDLLKRMRLGEEGAFKEIYERYWDRLLNTAFKRLNSIEMAEELVQDVFVSLYTRREKIKVKNTLEGYLRNALKYKIYDVFRSQCIHDKYVENAISFSTDVSFTPDQFLQLKELKDKIDQSAKKMPDRCREVFLLSRIEELPNKSIAEQLGISLSTVEKHISKAMTLIRKDFKDYNLEILLITAYLMMK